LADSLIEAELFGHERGAFTGADRRRDGRFKAADGGTLFLDEIAELSLPAQAKLLRVVQEGSFEALGSNTSTKVDVRIVSATHRDLRERIRSGAFREDLFFRIDVIEIPLPPLRERLSDLPLLVEHFLHRFLPKGTTTPLTITPEAWGALQQHRFPGNVRELSHAIQHAVVFSGGAPIKVEHLPPGFGPSVVPPSVIATMGGPAKAAADRPLVAVMRELEREYLVSALEMVQWKRVEAARNLGISRKTLWEKMKLYGLGDSE
jgi:DNA-binding NtrC family response regulator